MQVLAAGNKERLERLYNELINQRLVHDSSWLGRLHKVKSKCLLTMKTVTHGWIKSSLTFLKQDSSHLTVQSLSITKISGTWTNTLRKSLQTTSALPCRRYGYWLRQFYPQPQNTVLSNLWLVCFFDFHWVLERGLYGFIWFFKSVPIFTNLMAGSSDDLVHSLFYYNPWFPFRWLTGFGLKWEKIKTFAGLSKGYIFTLRCTPPYCFTIPCLFMVYLNF